MTLPLAGRELDREIALRVFGHATTHPSQSSPGWWLEWTEGEPETEGATARSLPDYSTDIAAAWEVVEKLEVDGKSFQIDRWRHPNGKVTGYWVQFWAPHSCAGAETAPLAICRAALLAVGPRG